MARILFALSIIALSGCMRPLMTARTPPPAPTKLDYVVLASMADTPRPLAMALYQPGSVTVDED
jgi:hypothetical protein